MLKFLFVFCNPSFVSTDFLVYIRHFNNNNNFQLPDRDAKFPCRVSGVPQPEVTWSKDGKPLTETDKFRIKRDGDACCLYVINCQPSDAGVYRAMATNQEGQDVCTATLEVVKEM